MNKTIQKVALATSTAVGSLQLLAGSAYANQININPNNGSGRNSFATDIGVVFRAVLNFILILAVLLVFGYLVLAGIEWITSGGDKGKTEGARNKITAAIIGLIILVSSYAILTLVLNFLGFDSQNLTLPTLEQFQ